MILGAGIYQLPLIKKAKELGCFTIVVSIPGNYPGFSVADKVYYLDTRDKDACLKIACEENIQAVCTTGTDVAIQTLGYIVDMLGLKGPSFDACRVASNKWLMKEAFAKGNVRAAKFQKVFCLDECLNAVLKIGFPCVLKVVDSSGSRGICVVKEENNLAVAYQSIKRYSQLDYVLVEEYLDGTDFGAQAVVYNGEVLCVIPHTTDVFIGDAKVPIGHTIPYFDEPNPELEKQISVEMKKAIASLGIDNAVVNADLMLVNDQPYIIEMGARCGATGLPEIDGLSYGLDFYKLILKIALGKLEANEVKKSKLVCAASSRLIVSSKSGILGNYNTPHHPRLKTFDMDYLEGEEIPAFRIGPDRLGSIVVLGRTKSDVVALSDRLMNDIQLQVI